MVFVTPKTKEVLDLKGLHLYHSGASNCAMRVRMTLEEKGLPWVSHHLDILKKEHLTPEYFGINPKGLVPTLVDDGVVITESDDIIDYLDKKFPDPPLRPTDERLVERMYYWLKLATDIHVPAVKTYIYDKKIRHFMKQSDAERTLYEELQTNQELLDFHHKSTTNTFSEPELRRAKQILDECFDEVERSLGGSEWMVGETLTLADIAWVPLYFTLRELAGYPFESYPNVLAWSKRLSARPSYQKAVIEWWPFKG
ncbi:MAG: glutathione S-transferase family protein [Hyphomonadaceae bacterium]|nr:glutathione S-transferase family protein [Hyphomonadaceae bacterium]